MAQIFVSNRYLNLEEAFVPYSLRIPIGINMNRIVKDGYWAWTLENTDFKMTIQVIGFSGGTLNGGAWGIFKADTSQYNRFSQTQYRILTHGETKFTKRYTPLTESYWKWFDNVSTSVRKFNWEAIDKAIVEKKSRDAIWKDNQRELPTTAETNTF